jgi:hypothetical protein
MGLSMIIPLAVHKNELVVIDSMETFSNYFCLAKKQKMTPLAVARHPAVEQEEAEEDEEKSFFEDGIEEAVDEEDDL